MSEQYSIQELAAKIRERRPDLKDIPDMTLVGKTLAAAPQLRPFLRDDTHGQATVAPGMFTPNDSTLYRGAKAVGNGLLDLLASPGAMIDAAAHPMAATAMAAGKAAEEYVKGEMTPKSEVRIPLGVGSPRASDVEKVGHYAAAALPGLGPWAAEKGEQIGSGDIVGGLGEAATVMGVPMVLGPKIEAGLNRLNVARTRPPLSELTDALSPNDLQFQKHAPIALDELKAASVSPNSIQEGLNAVDERFKVNQDAVRRVTTPQRGVDITPYRNLIIQKQLEAIPTDIDPIRLNRLKAKIYRSVPEKLTIGHVDDMRSELAATQSPFYGKDLSGQLTMDAGERAVNIARGNAAREVLYHALDNAPGAMGGGKVARGYNQRSGALIHMKDALLHAQNTAVAEHGSPLGDMTAKLRAVVGRPGRTIAEGLPKKIDEMFASSVKNWKGTPREIPIDFKWQGFEETPKGQMDLVPTGGELFGPNASTPYYPGLQPMDEVLRAQRVGVSPTPPERPMGQMDFNTQVPPDLFQDMMPQGPASAQRTLPLGGGIDQSPMPAAQMDMLEKLKLLLDKQY